MGKLERKIERSQLKEAHKRLKKQWRAENVRRAAGVEVPDVDTTSPTNAAPKDPNEISVPFVPNVKMKKLPLLGRPPSLGQYGKMVNEIVERNKKAAEEAKLDFLKKREAEEKKVAEEGWKDE